MNFPPPRWIREAAEEALNSVPANHYSHPKGRIRLREALKAFYDPLFKRDLSVDSEILITSGANEGIPHLCRSMRLGYSHEVSRRIFCLYSILRTGR